MRRDQCLKPLDQRHASDGRRSKAIESVERSNKEGFDYGHRFDGVVRRFFLTMAGRLDHRSIVDRANGGLTLKGASVLVTT